MDAATNCWDGIHNETSKATLFHVKSQWLLLMDCCKLRYDELLLCVTRLFVLPTRSGQSLTNHLILVLVFLTVPSSFILVIPLYPPACNFATVHFLLLVPQWIIDAESSEPYHT